MPAIRRDITIEIGSYWSSPVVLRQPDKSPYDLTDCTARMQIRDEDGQLLLELSTDNGRLEIDVPAGRIERRIGATATVGIEVEKGFYDMEIIPGGDPDRAWKLYRGAVEFIQEQTHE